MRLLILKSSLISMFSCLVTIPYFHYLVFKVSPITIQRDYSNPWSLIFAELFLLFFVCLLASASGLIFTNRYDLPGFCKGKLTSLNVTLLIFIGAALVFLSYTIFDRIFYLISPQSYPKEIVYIATFPLKGAFVEEVILRFCMVTLAYGLLRQKIASVVVVSFFSSLFSLQYFKYIGEDLQANNLYIIQFLLSFTVNIILGYLFITKGLIHSMILKFILYLKYPLVHLLIG